MIRREQMLEIARMTGMSPHQQEKHYIQTLILRSVYSSFRPVFKGGTCLMFIHGLNRFSEDLDFTVENTDLSSLGETVVKDLKYMGVRAEIKTISDAERSLVFRIGAEGPLFTREIERCYVRMDISRREKVILPAETPFISPPYPDILPFGILSMSVEEIMAEKVRAVMTRNKARDLYDLFYLINMGGKTKKSLVDAKLGYYEMEFDTETFRDKLNGKKGIWKQELRPVIFGEVPEFEGVAMRVERFNEWMV